MRAGKALFSLLFTLLTVPSFAQANDCRALAESVISVAMSGKAQPRFVGLMKIQIPNPATASVEAVDRLVYSTGASEITIDALPNYYSQGKCELKSLKIVRE